jgi:hypothetical protein
MANRSPVIERSFLQAGWIIIGSGSAPPDEFNRNQREIWEAHFGCDPHVCVLLWEKIEEIEPIPCARPKHLLYALHFLRCYNQEKIMKVTLKADEGTIRRWVWIYIERISSLTLDAIDWDRRFDGDSPIEGHYAYVDCSVFAVEEERKPFSTGWSAVKLGKKAGLIYEIASAISTGHIVWTNGPYPAGMYTDIKIFDRHGEMVSLRPLLLFLLCLLCIVHFYSDTLKVQVQLRLWQD